MKDEPKAVIKAPEEVKVLLHIRTSNNQVPKQIWVMGLSTRALPQTFDRPLRSEKGVFVLQLWQQRGEKLPQMILFDPTAHEAAKLRNVDPENPPKLIKLQPLPRSGGQVLNKAGKPIAGATVSLIVGRQETVTSGGRQFSFWEEQHLPINGTTDKRGRFSLPILPDTTCWALVRARGYHPDVVMLRPRLTALVRLEKGAYRYSGKLVDLYGDHLAGVKMEIQYRLPGGKQPEHNRTRRLPEYAIPLGRIQTDAQGRFAVDDMPSSLSILISPDTLSFPQHVKPSNELVLVMRPLMFVMRPHSTKGMIGPEPTSPRAKNLLKEAEWIQQPPQFNGKKTVLIFTSPHLKQNETLYQNIGLLSEEQWQVVTVFDSYNRQEVERYCRQIPIRGVVGHWKSRTRNDLPVLVTEILPTLPYVMLLDNDGNPVRYGVRPGNLLQEAGELP